MRKGHRPNEIYNRAITRILNRIYPSVVMRPMIKTLHKMHNDTYIDGLKGVEIGVHQGKHAYNILRTLPIQDLYLVDPYINETGNHWCDINYCKATRRLKRFKNCHFIGEKSDEAVSFFKDNSLDFVYIDGDHSYSQVMRDIENYYPKVKLGGVLGGHDFVACRTGLCRAVVEFADEHDLFLFGDVKDWWIIKK